MASRDSQIPRACESCGKTHSPSLCHVALKCWNCGKKHSATQEFCYACNSLTLPIFSREIPKTLISWNTFLIAKTDSSQVRSEQLTNAEMAISNDLYTAVLCAESPDAPYKEYKKKKTAVFLHRPGGEKRLSFTKLGSSSISTSSRKWEEIKLSDWTAFEEMVGVTSLPSNFPVPDNICLLKSEEGDTDVRGFDVGGPCTR
ncbi:hypothetical protein EAF00_002498 [Botryotinia globosa]|nr:hypothetical protein EAF00_002498 [Botryotinia globosa]